MFKENKNKCVDMCLEFLDDLLKLNDEIAGVKYNIWFCYYTLAELYYNLCDYIQSINQIQKSLQFITFKTYYYKSIWIAALSHEKLERYDKALEIYDDCLEYYCNIQSKKDIAVILKNKAEILKDVDMLLDSIDLYNEIDLILDGITQNTLDSYLDRAYMLLIDLYIESKNYFLARKYISNIKNTQLKNKYCKLINGNLLLV